MVGLFGSSLVDAVVDAYNLALDAFSNVGLATVATGDGENWQDAESAG
jgi:hypothetical protein